MITETANARILPGTLAKIHEIKSLLGFKTLLEAAEYIVSEIHKSPAVLGARNANALITRNQERIAKIQVSASRK